MPKKLFPSSTRRASFVVLFNGYRPLFGHHGSPNSDALSTVVTNALLTVWNCSASWICGSQLSRLRPRPPAAKYAFGQTRTRQKRDKLSEPIERYNGEGTLKQSARYCGTIGIFGSGWLAANCLDLAGFHESLHVIRTLRSTKPKRRSRLWCVAGNIRRLESQILRDDMPESIGVIIRGL